MGTENRSGVVDPRKMCSISPVAKIRGEEAELARCDCEGTGWWRRSDAGGDAHFSHWGQPRWLAVHPPGTPLERMTRRLLARIG